MAACVIGSARREQLVRSWSRSAWRRRERAGAGATWIAIVVPYRPQREQDRAAQLHAFLRHMAAFVAAGGGDPLALPSPTSGADRTAQGVRFIVIVVQQSEDGRKFNRGQLLNTGYREAQRVAGRGGLASVILHDVDLLPPAGLRPWYAAAPRRHEPVHLAGSGWAKYEMPGYDFFGGVTAFHPADVRTGPPHPCPLFYRFPRSSRPPCAGRMRVGGSARKVPGLASRPMPHRVLSCALHRRLPHAMRAAEAPPLALQPPADPDAAPSPCSVRSLQRLAKRLLGMGHGGRPAETARQRERRKQRGRAAAAGERGAVPRPGHDGGAEGCAELSRKGAGVAPTKTARGRERCRVLALRSADQLPGGRESLEEGAGSMRSSTAPVIKADQSRPRARRRLPPISLKARVHHPIDPLNPLPSPLCLCPQAVASAHLINARFFHPSRLLGLDPEWQSSNGLRGLCATVLERSEAPLPRVAAKGAWGAVVERGGSVAEVAAGHAGRINPMVGEGEAMEVEENGAAARRLSRVVGKGMPPRGDVCGGGGCSLGAETPPHLHLHILVQLA
jgi:hypothetical protein